MNRVASIHMPLLINERISSEQNAINIIGMMENIAILLWFHEKRDVSLFRSFLNFENTGKELLFTTFNNANGVVIASS